MKLAQILSPTFSFRIFLSLLLPVSFLIMAQVNASEYSDNKDVKIFINEMAKKHRFNKEYLQKLFDEAKLHKSILEAIARPAEGKPWHQYRPIFLSKERAMGGVRFWKENAEALKRATQKYGVPEEIIVAIIGVETRYGKHAGRYPVFESLSTLAFAYPPRAKFFKSELEHFLLMTKEEDMPVKDLLGSYAGAMGMPQFISSSFRSYAVDFDNDGKRDLWNNPTDAIGSVANYFKRHHWKPGQPITHKVQVHGKRYPELLTKSLKPSHTQQKLLDYGVILPSDVPAELKGKFLELKTTKKPEYWVAWNNFYVITRYNHSALYSMAVHQLSQEIKKAYTDTL